MSSVTRALCDHMLADANITALVGTRIYQDMAPAGSALPRITFSLGGEDYVEQLQGAAADLVHTTIQVDCWAATPDSTTTIAEALRQSLQGFIGAMGDLSLDVRHCTIRGRFSLFSEPDSADDISIYRISQDARIISTQPVPPLPA